MHMLLCLDLILFKILIFLNQDCSKYQEFKIKPKLKKNTFILTMCSIHKDKKSLHFRFVINIEYTNIHIE